MLPPKNLPNGRFLHFVFTSNAVKRPSETCGFKSALAQILNLLPRNSFLFSPIVSRGKFIGRRHQRHRHFAFRCHMSALHNT